MPTVTVVGVHGSTLPLTFNSAQQVAIAQQLANVINNQVASGALLPEQAQPIGGPTLPKGASGELVIQSAGFYSLAPAYRAIIDTAPNAILLGDSQTNQTIMAAPGGLTYVGGSGSGSIVAGDSANDIVTGGKSWYVSTGGGNDTLVAGTGAVTLAAGGGSNTIVLGSGPALVDVTGRDNISGGSGAATVAVEAGGHAYFQGGSGNLLFIDQGTGSTVVGGTGSETIFGSTGGSYAGGSGGNNVIYGAGTLTGGGGGDQLFANGSANSLLLAASGNETLSAAQSSGTDTLVASSGVDNIVAGSGRTTVVAGTGSGTLAGGAGHDLFQFVATSGGGHYTIADFTSADAVKLVGYDPNEAHNALLGATTAAGATTLHLHDNTTITFANIVDPSKINIS